MVSFPPQGSGGSGGGSGAPTDATYVTTSANATLSAEVLLSTSNGSGTLASRPAAGTAGITYYATDMDIIFRDSGSAWVIVGGGPHAALLQQLDAASKLPSSVFKGFVQGQQPDAFDAETTVASQTVTPVVGGIAFDWGGTSGESFAAYNIGSSKSEVLIVVGVQAATVPNFRVGVRTAAFSNGNAGGDGYIFNFKTGAAQGYLQRVDSDSRTILSQWDDGGFATGGIGIMALYANGSTNVQEIYKGATKLLSGSDANHTSFASVYFNGGTTNEFWFSNPILIMTN